MFYAVYEFHVKKDVNKEFEDIWNKITIYIRDNNGGLGSRLHKAIGKDNMWVAYAKWPNREKWSTNAPLNDPNLAPMVQQMRDLCLKINTVYELEETDDLTVN